MFSRGVIDTDRFYDLPFNSQLLYFHLGLNADVKGFVEPKRICRLVGLKVEDMKALIHEGFVIPFESGVVVITHWKVNNNIREDYEADSLFKDEYAKLVDIDGVYSTTVVLQQDSGSTTGQIRLDKDRLDKIRLDKKPTQKAEKVKYSSLEDITDIEIQEIATSYEVPISFVKSKVEDIRNYCESTGKSYKNYLATLRGWVKRDSEKLRKETYAGTHNKKKRTIAVYQGE